MPASRRVQVQLIHIIKNNDLRTFRPVAIMMTERTTSASVSQFRQCTSSAFPHPPSLALLSRNREEYLNCCLFRFRLVRQELCIILEMFIMQRESTSEEVGTEIQEIFQKKLGKHWRGLLNFTSKFPSFFQELSYV